eukprot:CAMPEP_0176150790 /NCGR_PEP_ID=MMETSP0120_2-20121206/76999_1 /TAXON_ID=160619 /ORGANISM="Kryptoperidinium foliaceum, Strain CCMP 1326" /LENGTH=126 /DNA_ID=CAMNT_0017487731 /DNA_START=170 /DNA_END=547 /DNA_ORIENTATION=-
MEDSFLLSKSFGGGPPMLPRRQPAPVQRHASGVSKITYRGYLLKRSNEPYQTVDGNDHQDDDGLPMEHLIVPQQAEDGNSSFPELPMMPGMFTNHNSSSGRDHSHPDLPMPPPPPPPSSFPSMCMW